jgi:DNA-binding NarL/FixJ family response regulator
MGLEPAAAPATSGPEAVVGAPARLRIFVADSHPGVLEALGDVIGDQPDLTLVGEAATAPTLIASPALRDADVLVLDLALGPGLIEQARAVAPSLRVVAQSILPREPFEGAAMRAGESAFVAKGEHPAALLAAIRMHGNS